MRLVLVGPAYPLRGGISHYNSSLFQELSRRHEVEAVSFTHLYPGFLFPGTSQFDRGEDVFGIGARALIHPTSPLSWRRAASEIARSRPRAVIFQWWHSFFAPAYRSIASRLARSHEARLLVCCHNVFPHERPPRLLRPLEERLVRAAMRRFDGALVHSPQEAERLRAVAPGLAVRSEPHPAYGFYSRWASGRRAREGPLRLLYFGTVRRYKGLEVLLRALPSVAERVDVQVTVAGEFYVDQEPLRRIVTEGGLEERVDWRNRYIPNEEVAELFESADLVVVPYLRATQSGVIGVAYEFGVPVVASDIEGLAGAVREGETGLLASPGDASGLAEAIVRFAREDDPDRYRRAIASLRAELSWARLADGILSFVPGEEHG